MATGTSTGTTVNARAHFSSFTWYGKVGMPIWGFVLRGSEAMLRTDRKRGNVDPNSPGLDATTISCTVIGHYRIGQVVTPLFFFACVVLSLTSTQR